MKEDINQYISDISAEKIYNSNVVTCTNNEGYSTILIRNEGDNHSGLIFNNDFFCMKNNVQLSIGSRDLGLFHIIICKKADEENISHFKRVCNYLFIKQNKALSSEEMIKLFNSLEAVFSSSATQDVTAEIGLFGELLVLNYIHDSNSNIYSSWHNCFLNKHDIEANEKVKIEIKTTVKDFRKHTFSHEQICRPHLKVYVASVLLKSVETGTSLYEYCIKTMSLLNSDQILNLEKQMRKLGLSDNYGGIECIIGEAYDEIKFYDADDLPKITSIPDGISNVQYDIDFSNINSIYLNNIELNY